MDYREALKQVQAETKKTRDHYLVFSFGYSANYVLPYKEGVALLSTLAHAEQISDRYSNKREITPIPVDAFSVHPMSQEEYQRIRLANLLRIPVDDVEELEKVPA